MRIRCPKCTDYTVDYNPRTKVFACFRPSCNWSGPDGYIYHCPVCHADWIDIGNLIFHVNNSIYEEDPYSHEGSHCYRCGTMFYFPKWNGNL